MAGYCWSEDGVSVKLVTVKIRQPGVRHDPYNKKKGVCPLSGHQCTDTTGAHHTVLVRTKAEMDVLSQYHITRVEEVRS